MNRTCLTIFFFALILFISFFAVSLGYICAIASVPMKAHEAMNVAFMSIGIGCMTCYAKVAYEKLTK